MSSLRFTVAVVASSVFTLVSCSTDGRTMQEPTPSQIAAVSPGDTLPAQGGDVIEESTPLTLTAPWASGTAIDVRYTCDGKGISPPLAWSSGPAETKAYGIVLNDVDDPNFNQWVVANIDPAYTSIGEGGTITGSFIATNGLKSRGYAAPCPRKGSTHTFTLSVFALRDKIEVEPRPTAKTALARMTANALEVGTIDFVYSR